MFATQWNRTANKTESSGEQMLQDSRSVPNMRFPCPRGRVDKIRGVAEEFFGEGKSPSPAKSNGLAVANAPPSQRFCVLSHKGERGTRNLRQGFRENPSCSVSEIRYLRRRHLRVLFCAVFVRV